MLAWPGRSFEQRCADRRLLPVTSAFTLSRANTQLSQKIEVRWPSGLRQTVKDVHADQILQIDEPATRWPVMERP
ncbi:MAG: hypothetical protein DMG70_31405 [Acidobacteria bacterium]|nr:MAG: hypothetical protein DMG70_31405 [Acidobacteriota bacterium]